MKRKGNLYDKVWSIDNLRLALYNARKGKKRQRSVIRFMEKEEENLLLLQNELRDKTYRTSPYTTFVLVQDKVRNIHRLPFRDRVCHHAIAAILTPILYPTFTADTYSSIPGRGVHSCSYKLRAALKNPMNKYVLKLDVKKYYENINHSVLKMFIRRKIKDNDFLWLLDEIISSVGGGDETVTSWELFESAICKFIFNRIRSLDKGRKKDYTVLPFHGRYSNTCRNKTRVTCLI